MPKMLQLPPEVERRMPNATIAAGMVISFGNVLQHHDPRKAVENKIVVVGTQEDVEEAVEEDAEVVEEDHSQLEPLWSCRDQMYLHRICNRIQVHP